MRFSTATLPLMSLPLGVLSVVAFVCFTVNLSAAPSALKIEFAEHRVSVSGLPSGHKVVLFGEGIGMYSYAPLFVRYTDVASDDDADGVVHFAVRHLPQRSVWICVDFETGDYAVGAPTGGAVPEFRLSPDIWKAGNDHLDVRSENLDVVVVRPRVGAWTLRIVDGGPNDEDGHSNGAVTLRLGRMLPIAGEMAGPPVVTGKDVILAVDPQTLNVFLRQAE